MRACARTHTHTLSLFLPAPYCQFIDVLFSCRPLFVSGVCFVTVVVSPCRVQRIRLSTLLPLALNTAPRYCLLLALALLLSALFSSFPLKLINAFLSRTLSHVSPLLTCSSCAVLHKLCWLT